MGHLLGGGRPGINQTAGSVWLRLALIFRITPWVRPHIASIHPSAHPSIHSFTRSVPDLRLLTTSLLIDLHLYLHTLPNTPVHRPTGISRDSRHKRSATGAKRAQYRKKRKFELGRQAAMTKLGAKRVHSVRVRGGNVKFRAMRLDTGNFSWGSEALSRKTRIIDVVYNASNNELVRTKTLVKGAVVQIDATPFRQWWEGHYGQALGKKGQAKKAAAAATPVTPVSFRRGTSACTHSSCFLSAATDTLTFPIHESPDRDCPPNADRGNQEVQPRRPQD